MSSLVAAAMTPFMMTSQQAAPSITVNGEDITNSPGANQTKRKRS